MQQKKLSLKELSKITICYWTKNGGTKFRTKLWVSNFGSQSCWTNALEHETQALKIWDSMPCGQKCDLIVIFNKCDLIVNYNY
jgi:hypothetical protein